MHACACFIKSVFVYVYMGFILECIYMNIESIFIFECRERKKKKVIYP